MQLSQVRKIIRKIPGAAKLASLNPFRLRIISVPINPKDGTDTARGAFLVNVRVLTATLEESGIEYFLVKASSDERPYRIAISENDKNRFLHVLHSKTYKKYPAMYIGRPEPETERTTIQPVGLLDNYNKNTKRIGDAQFIRLWANRASSSGAILFGVGYGCDVEFWKEGDSLKSRREIPSILGVKSLNDLRGGLIAPRVNKVAHWIPKSERKIVATKINGYSFKTLRCFTYTLLDEIDFPVDIVYSWVDGSDPTWHKKMMKYKTEYMPNSINNSASRYESRDELKYSLRSLHMFASHFIRNIYIITDEQKPDWLRDDHPQIHIVDHKDIFNTKSALPVFNSHAISSQAHHIDGLSEHYIYINDDVFFSKLAVANDFFHVTGIMKVNFSSAQFGLGKPLDSESAPSSAGKNVRELIMKSEKRYITNKNVHAPIPQRRSIAYELEKKYHAAFTKTSKSKFRSPNDIAFANTTHLNYAVANGKAVPCKYRTQTINISQLSSSVHLESIKNESRKYKTICLNDTNTSLDNLEQVNNAVAITMEALFPVKAPWEK